MNNWPGNQRVFLTRPSERRIHPAAMHKVPNASRINPAFHAGLTPPSLTGIATKQKMSVVETPA
jgi:hypothetical protein